MSRAVLGIGGNLGDRVQTLARARRALDALPGTAVVAVSSLYETAPVGYAEQPPFLNAVLVVETALSPRALLGACLGIEAGLGRVRTFRNAPRVVDIDLLVMEGVSAEDEELTLPHPRMAERGFVLVPLEELFPDGRVLGRDFGAAMAAVSRDGVKRYALFPAETEK